MRWAARNGANQGAQKFQNSQKFMPENALLGLTSMHPLHLKIGLRSIGLMSVQLKEEQGFNLDGLLSALVSN